MKAIERFCKETGFAFQGKGEIGFGRPCVGVMNPETECYVAYSQFDLDTGKDEFFHFVASNTRPGGAYHKGDYLAVLVREDGPKTHEEAIEALEGWVQRILDAGYKVVTYEERNSITGLLSGKAVVNQKGIADKR